jgi:hypothetical protein
MLKIMRGFHLCSLMRQIHCASDRIKWVPLVFGHERPDGIEALCEDLAVSPTDIRVLLLLAWKLQAGQQGYFSLDEWQKGMNAM